MPFFRLLLSLSILMLLIFVLHTQLTDGRHWQELGFLIIYVTSRPDFQKTKVMTWLAEHNFPFGLVNFGEGISKELQRHKTEFLHTLVREVSANIFTGNLTVKNYNE